MRISEQIKALCNAKDISIAELARRTGQSPQCLNGKLKRNNFKVEDLESIAVAMNCKFERNFVLPNGDKI